MLPRLEKVSKSLTGKERALLFLRSRNAENPAPGVRSEDFIDNAQRLQYDRYMGVLYIANSELGNLLDLISRQVEWMAEQPKMFELVRGAAEVFAEEEGEPIDWRRARLLPKKETVKASMYLANLSEQARDLAADDVLIRWKELRALEIVWEVMAQDFDGEDPVDPELRALAAKTGTLLAQLAGRCGLKKLPEPGQDFIDRTWELVDRTYETLKLVKPEP